MNEGAFVHESAAGDAVGVQTKIPAVANGLEAGLDSDVELGKKGLSQGQRLRDGLCRLSYWS